MDIKISEQNGSRVAVIGGTDCRIAGAQDALDLIATLGYEYGAQKFTLPQGALDPRFFDLSTGLAGEILQKFVNYRAHVAIIGDFSAPRSQSLADFIRESNRRGSIFFLPDEESALAALHGA